MALSIEEKARRRAAINARNRAHHARYREYLIAKESGEKEIDARLGPNIETASAAEDGLREERRSALDDVDRQIAELHARKLVIQNDFSDRMGKLHAVTRALVDQMNVAKRELDVDLDRWFPDLVGAAFGSAACWKPISDYEGADHD